jgi:tRNA pseudouridine38-40 synthase
MERYFLNLSYDGSPYNGWQRQIHGVSVQQTLESVLSKIFHQNIIAYGCGRTDAGVHAENYIAHINLSEDVETVYAKKIINLNLPPSIALNQITKVSSFQHARFDAIKRRYKYIITLKKIPQWAAFSGYYPEITFQRIQEVEKAMDLILKQNDFRAFCNSPDKHNHTYCHLTKFELIQPSPHHIEFTIEGNRFLKQMVRIIIGSLIEILKGQIEAKDLERSFEKGELVFAKRIAKASGLHFVGVDYPYSITHHP